VVSSMSELATEYDVFISHASEDKDSFVRALARALEARRIRVWYDEFTLQPGDSLRRSIDRGLLTSQAGIVILSQAFFTKRWPAYELDGLVELQNSTGDDNTPDADQRGRIIPVWHDVDVNTVRRFSPSLANVVALQSSLGIDEVADRIATVLRPSGSALLFAYRELAQMAESYGWAPHIITDDWWLDVVETNNANDAEGTFQEAMGWGRWGFPLPPRSTEPRERGHRLAWAAAQMIWQRVAEKSDISQLTPPDEVLDFISSCPGLVDMCIEHPSYMLSYAPQLALPGVADYLQATVDATVDWARGRIRDGGINPDSKAGRLRLASDYGYLGFSDAAVIKAAPADVACSWVQGEIHGPPIRVYEPIDHAAWLVSEKSKWLDNAQRQALLAGIAEWAVWPMWRERDGWREQERLLTLLDEDRLSAAKRDTIATLIANKLSATVAELGLEEPPQILTERLLDAGLVTVYRRREKRKRQPTT
jgi:TIR domain